MVTSATKVARALTRDFGEIEQLQTSRAGSAEFTERAFNYGSSVLKENLAKAHPERDVLLAGVGNAQLGKINEFWVANPICGRINFSHGIPHFAVTIAHVRAKETLAAVVYDSVHDDLYWAEKGIGAYRNDRRIRVSERRQIKDTVIGNHEESINDPYVQQARGNLARAYFYMSFLYRIQIQNSLEENLRAWHFEDPPDKMEEIRNSLIEQVQGNRNPFIDHPEAVERVRDF